ncbi:DUF1254 domain-containing protein [Falsihalocynthiibacter arcticus]|uniref:DUF1254 domain-containing protein n=1 Tax=Falsihalocynthiibacter arcticus TaxID=1579316 RepID=A0A126UZL5_9RHOB|nr:DUF1254 domain-containing protein [Falsihalocynthiibacter arcticus]AML51512.1 hypothetical protein RC74_09785 [Falsihalocynthiibacter arcticus]
MTFRFSKTRRAVLFGLAMVAVAFAFATPPTAVAAQPVTKHPDAIALEAYYFLYPLMVMDYTRRQLSNVPAGHPGLAAPMNTFAASRGFPTPEMHSVPRPNFDTLYSPAWLDLTQGPVLIQTPDTGERYYVATLLDMWSEVFASIGSRTTGNKAGSFFVTPPDWSSAMPEGLPKGTIEIAAPTTYAWLIGRTQTNGEKDFDVVHALQDQFALTPYGSDGTPLEMKAFEQNASIDMKTPPNLQVEALTGVEFFTQAAELLKLQPAHLIDWPFVERMQRIGLVAGESYDASAQSEGVVAALNAAPAEAITEMTWKFPRMSSPINQWSIMTGGIGTYGTAYFQRAVIAKFGLGSNVPQDSVYPLTFTDADGNALDGNNAYVLHFDKANLPPVEAFWSLSLYDNDGFPIANPINRYAVSSWMPLTYNADGSLDIYIQSEAPDAEKEANWLPSLKAGFGLNMRLYAPMSDVISGKWAPPAVVKVN